MTLEEIENEIIYLSEIINALEAEKVNGKYIKPFLEQRLDLIRMIYKAKGDK